MLEKEANKLCEVFGSKIIKIHHLGSMSVNALNEKPIIDIMPVVKNIDLIDGFNTEMKNISYDPKRENKFSEPRFFQKREDTRTHDFHILN